MNWEVAAGCMTGWGGRVEPEPHAIRRMTTKCTHGRLATSVRSRNELVPPNCPPVAQLQPVLLSWWSGKVGRFLCRG